LVYAFAARTINNAGANGSRVRFWHAVKSFLRASLGTPFSQGIFIFPREISLFFIGKMKIPWENGVPKLGINCGQFCTVAYTRRSLIVEGCDVFLRRDGDAVICGLYKRSMHACQLQRQGK
jgi:hypothetical protein